MKRSKMVSEELNNGVGGGSLFKNHIKVRGVQVHSVVSLLVDGDGDGAAATGIADLPEKTAMDDGIMFQFRSAFWNLEEQTAKPLRGVFFRFGQTF
nr:hypothetical protein Iba_chr08dCG6320 [Ipomoea batatas]